jgi:hypothetical protein
MLEQIPNNVDFDKVDWVVLARQLGLKLSDEPIEITRLGTPYRQYLASVTMASRMVDCNLRLEQINDELDEMMDERQITSFDKACIKLYLNRIVENEKLPH